MRDKWDRTQSGTTYGWIIFEKSIVFVTNTYLPYTPIPSEVDFSVDLTEYKPFTNSKYPCTNIGNSNLFVDFYKDNVEGKISDGSFMKMSASYETGKIRVQELENIISSDIEYTINTNHFLTLV